MLSNIPCGIMPKKYVFLISILLFLTGILVLVNYAFSNVVWVEDSDYEPEPSGYLGQQVYIYVWVGAYYDGQYLVQGTVSFYFDHGATQGVNWSCDYVNDPYCHTDSEGNIIYATNYGYAMLKMYDSGLVTIIETWDAVATVP